MKIKTFTERYCVEKTLAEIRKMYDKYKETRMTPQAEMTKPSKIAPLYKQENRKKVFYPDHIKEKDNPYGPVIFKDNTGRFFIPVIFHAVRTMTFTF